MCVCPVCRFVVDNSHRKCNNLLRDAPLKTVGVKRTPGEIAACVCVCVSVHLPVLAYCDLNRSSPVSFSRAAKRPRLSSSDRDEDNSDEVPTSITRFRRLMPSSQRSRERESESVTLHWPVSLFCVCVCLLFPLSLSWAFTLSMQTIQKSGGTLGFPVYSVYSGSGAAVSRPLCLQCGSGGLEKLLVCVVCCQSFHWFCVGLANCDLGNSDSFVCRSCIACNVCGLPDKVGGAFTYFALSKDQIWCDGKSLAVFP